MQWLAIIPEWQNIGGMKFVGANVSHFLFSEGLPLLEKTRVIKETLLAWCLTLFPICLYFWKINFHMICKESMGRYFVWLTYAAACSPIILLLLITDFGRVISYSCCIFLIFMLFFIKSKVGQKQDLLNMLSGKWFTLANPVTLCLCALYLYSWNLRFCVSPQDSACLVRWFF